MTPYYATGAYRSAVAHPYHVSTYRGWADHHPLVVGFQTEDEARAYAAGRPEPLIDLVQRDCGVIAARRMLRHPYGRAWRMLHDDFAPLCTQNTSCETDPAFPHNVQASCRPAERTER